MPTVHGYKRYWAPRPMKGRLAAKGFEWHADDSEAKRRAALARVVEKDGYATTVRRLNMLNNISKVPKVHAATKADMTWLKKTFRNT